MVPGNVSPMAEIVTNRRDALLGDGLGGLQSMGDTPLYQAVDTFAAQQAGSWSSDRITAIVLLQRRQERHAQRSDDRRRADAR